MTLPISVWLKPSTPTLHFCMICREPLKFTVEGKPDVILFGIDAAQIQAKYTPLKFPIRNKCWGKSQVYGKCPALWIVQGIIED